MAFAFVSACSSNWPRHCSILYPPTLVAQTEPKAHARAATLSTPLDGS